MRHTASGEKGCSKRLDNNKVLEPVGIVFSEKQTIRFKTFWKKNSMQTSPVS